jgi:hypothetical protein
MVMVRSSPAIHVQGLLNIMQTLLVAISVHQLSILRQALLFFSDGEFAASLCLCVVVVCAETETDCCDDGDVPGEGELV